MTNKTKSATLQLVAFIYIFILNQSDAFFSPHHNNCCRNNSLLPPFGRSITTTSSIGSHRILKPLVQVQGSNNENENEYAENENTDKNGIDTNEDPRLYRIRIPRATGIEWGTDLSFSFVYVRNMDPSGPASLSGLIEVQDQICEVRPVLSSSQEKEQQQQQPINLIGASFDSVMETFASLDRKVKDVDIVFFKGTKDELKALCQGGGETNGNMAENDSITITVIQNKGSKEEKMQQIVTKRGTNIRQVLVDNGINVYQSITRWTNCKGKQLCGTCIVNIKDGGMNTNRKSMDEASTLRENPDSYRLSCVTFAYGDVTVETFPTIEAAQWTR